MKKLMYIAVAMVIVVSATSCTQKRYLVIDNKASVEEPQYGIDGTMYDVYIQCYVGDDMADMICLDEVKVKTKSDRVLLPKKTSKVQISYGLAPKIIFESLGLPPKMFRSELVGYRFTDKRITEVRFDNNTMTK
jgi:hypothetical protein